LLEDKSSRKTFRVEAFVVFQGTDVRRSNCRSFKGGREKLVDRSL
jgi:hypothetical protein